MRFHQLLAPLAPLRHIFEQLLIHALKFEQINLLC
jgi:hypothetical protein